MGYDANKKIRGRKRHPVTDTLGLLLALKVQPANIQDGHGGVDVIVNAVDKYPSIKTLFADESYLASFKTTAVFSLLVATIGAVIAPAATAAPFIRLRRPLDGVFSTVMACLQWLLACQ